MNQKSVLSAVCLCLMAGVANAEIINYSFSASQFAQAANILNPALNDTQSASVSSSTATSYTNMVSAHTTTDSVIVSGVDYGDASASASSALGINADIDAGVFSGWGNIQTSVLSAPEIPGAMSAFGDAGSSMNFFTTTAYEYTLDVTISLGEWSLLFSSGPFNPLYQLKNYDDNLGQSLHLSGTFLANSIIDIGVSYAGGAGYTGIVNGFKPSGSFQYTLTLTPVPVPEPETWGLMLSGLGLVGWAARRRKHAAV